MKLTPDGPDGGFVGHADAADPVVGHHRDLAGATGSVRVGKTFGFIWYLWDIFYGVQFLNKSMKPFVMFHQLFQSAEETFFTII